MQAATVTRRLSAAALCALLVGSVALAAPWPPGPHGRITPPKTPDVGRFLVASRSIRGNFFAETVVLLVDYGPEGAVGLVVNRPTEVALSEVLSSVGNLAQREDRLYLGGPVDPADQVTLLLRQTEPPQDAREVLKGVYATASENALRRAIAAEVPPAELRVFAGYAGWAPLQLDGEIARGDWHISDGSADVVFESKADDIWRTLIAEHEGLQVRGPGAALQAVVVGSPPSASP